MGRTYVLVKINRFDQLLDSPPWPSGLRRLFLKPEIVGSSPAGAGLHFIFFFHEHFQCLNFCTWYALLKNVPEVRFSTKHTMCKSCKRSLGHFWWIKSEIVLFWLWKTEQLLRMAHGTLGVGVRLQNFQKLPATKYSTQALKVDFIWKLTSRATRWWQDFPWKSL